MTVSERQKKKNHDRTGILLFWFWYSSWKARSCPIKLWTSKTDISVSWSSRVEPTTHYQNHILPWSCSWFSLRLKCRQVRVFTCVTLTYHCDLPQDIVIWIFTISLFYMLVKLLYIVASIIILSIYVFCTYTQLFTWACMYWRNQQRWHSNTCECFS